MLTNSADTILAVYVVFDAMRATVLFKSNLNIENYAFE